MLNGYTPIFSQFGNDIYASDVVQQAISCIVQEMKKLNPQHIRKQGFDVIPVEGATQTVLDNPNPLMTTSDFIEKMLWSLFLNYNAWVYPVYGANKKLIALYPLQPVQVTFLQDSADTLYVELNFANGYKSTIPYQNIIHIRYKYSVNDYMGGNQAGQPDNDALLKTLELNNTLLQGVAKALKSSFSINGVVKYNTMLDKGAMNENLKELEGKLAANESGFLPMDIKGDFIPLKHEIQLVDDKTLAFIDNKILRHFGVPLPILTGDYTTEQLSAFYQKTLEPLIISLSQVFTKTIFTETEKAHGNKIVFYPEELLFMNTAQRLEMIRLLGDSGALYENEKRTVFGLKPLAELAGVRQKSLNYVDVSIANEYQLQTAKGKSKEQNGGDQNAGAI
jgi:HK97 family phage portal protein